MRSKFPVLQVSASEILNQNGLAINNTDNRTTISFKRNTIYLVVVASLPLVALVIAILLMDFETTLVCIFLIIISFLEIWRKRKGRPCLIFDREHGKLIIPSNNEYEETSEIGFCNINGFINEKAGQGELNYFFANDLTKEPRQILKLRLKNHIEITTILNWFESQLSK